MHWTKIYTVLSALAINFVWPGRIDPTQKSVQVSRNSNVTLTWNVLPLSNEKADWSTIYHQADENQIIQPIWDDIKGVTKFGKQKFNDKMSINAGQKNQVVLHVEELKESMTIYLTVVFIDKKTGEIQGGPLYSKIPIIVKVGYAKVTVQPICYKPLGRSPALFKLPMTGKISSIRLEHVSGYISCSSRKEKSYWACGCCYQSTSVLTLITDAKDNPQFPVKNYETKVGHKEFTVPGFNQMSKFLVLPSPKEDLLYYGRKDEVLKVWFGEDFVPWATTDNSGKHCVHVWVNYQ
ncbi:uncharacterized protein [Clytia hemisphaerica]|uniref:Cnidarian restricted protein n=1 Tax=Clytia hemisphaerica TaxID=252671 RepID=A0A7M5UC87_9CNID